MADGFNVVFRGELTGDQSLDTVKRNLAALFKMPAQRVDALFSGRPVVVKRGVDEDTARRFEGAFRKVGAVCELQPVGGPSGPSDARPRRVPEGSRPTDPAATRGARAAADPAPAAGPSAAAGHGATERPSSSALAAGDPNQTILDLAIPEDLGGLAIDDSDAPLEPPNERTPPEIDTSGLSIADDDAPLSDRPRQPAPEIDTSALSLEPEEPGSGPRSKG